MAHHQDLFVPDRGRWELTESAEERDTLTRSNGETEANGVMPPARFSRWAAGLRPAPGIEENADHKHAGGITRVFVIGVLLDPCRA